MKKKNSLACSFFLNWRSFVFGPYSLLTGWLLRSISNSYIYLQPSYPIVFIKVKSLAQQLWPILLKIINYLPLKGIFLHSLENIIWSIKSGVLYQLAPFESYVCLQPLHLTMLNDLVDTIHAWSHVQLVRSGYKLWQSIII